MIQKSEEKANQDATEKPKVSRLEELETMLSTTSREVHTLSGEIAQRDIYIIALESRVAEQVREIHHVKEQLQHTRSRMRQMIEHCFKQANEAREIRAKLAQYESHGFQVVERAKA